MIKNESKLDKFQDLEMDFKMAQIWDQIWIPEWDREHIQDLDQKLDP